MFSILIPSYNNHIYLKKTIDSIIKTSYLDNEILVHVSDDNENLSRNYLSKKNIQFTYTPQNSGLCTAMKIISKKISKNYVIYSPDDMYFCPGWENALKNEILKIGHNKFYLSGTMIEKYTGHIKFDCGENLDEFNEKKLLDNLSILNISDHQGSHFAPHCVHRSMWEKVSGFSEEFNPGIGSDPDFNMKLWKEGVRIFKGLNAFKVYHFGSITTRKKSNIVQNRGDVTFLRKWGITTKFFKKHYLKSQTKFLGPLSEPNKNLLFYIDMFKSKARYLYTLITNKR